MTMKKQMNNNVHRTTTGSIAKETVHCFYSEWLTPPGCVECMSEMSTMNVFLSPDLDFLSQYSSAPPTRRTPLGTPGGQCYSPLSVFNTPASIREEETDSQGHAAAQDIKQVSLCCSGTG